MEHDYVHLYTESTDTAPDPLATGVVNDAIRLFAISLPLQASKVQEGILEQISSMLASISQQSPAKYVAVCINIATALYLALQVGSKETMYASGNLKTNEIEKAMQELLHVSLFALKAFHRTYVVRRSSLYTRIRRFETLERKHLVAFAKVQEANSHRVKSAFLLN